MKSVKIKFKDMNIGFSFWIPEIGDMAYKTCEEGCQVSDEDTGLTLIDPEAEFEAY